MRAPSAEEAGTYPEGLTVIALMNPFGMGDLLTAWAFGHWGGDFWLFFKRPEDSSSIVYRLKTSDGSVTAVVSNTGRIITGAGVSTCAPIMIDF